MSLIRLLTSGKSLVGLQDSESRYRMRARNLLPKFGSAKNPFLARPEATHRAPASSAAPEPVPGVPEKTPAELAAAALETKRLPMVTSIGEAKKILGPGRVAGLFDPVRHWVGKLNPFGGNSRQGRAAKPAIPAFNRSPVQGELSLKNIKVVRNDLTEADVEIVPAKSPAKMKPEVVRQAKERTPLAATQPG